MIIGSAATASLAFVLGLRHGLDADHLAAIDGLTRCNASAKRRLAPLCGVLFTAGHAGAILAVAVVLALVAGRWSPPQWLSAAGVAISAVTLLLLAVLNLRAGWTTTDSADVRPIGLRSKLLSCALRAPRYWQVALVGGLFAVSFDAVAMATLFAASAPQVSGVIGIALAFAAGMLLVGFANGLWVVRLLRHSGDASRIASRVMTLTIGAVALLVSVCVLLPTFYAPVGRLIDAYDFIVSGLVVTLVLAGYCLSLILAHRARTPSLPERITPDIQSG